MRDYIVDIFISLVIAAIVVAVVMAIAVWIGCPATCGPQDAPTLAECLSSIQQVDDSTTGVTEGDGIAYESFICETADYDYVITRDRRGE